MSAHKQPWVGSMDWPFWGTALSSQPDTFLMFVTVDRDSDREIQIRVTKEQARTMGRELSEWGQS